MFGIQFANNPKYRGVLWDYRRLDLRHLAFIGFEEAAPLAEEAHELRRNVRRAVLFSCLGVGLFYVINTYASTVFYGPGRMLGFVAVGNSNPWQDVLARDAWGAAGFVIVFLARLNSVIANLNAANNSSTRNLYAMGRIRLLPRSFALLTRRFGSPVVGLWAQLLITIGVSLWLGLQYTPYTAFALTATIIVDVFVPLYILLNVACIVYYARYRRAEFNWLLHGLIPRARHRRVHPRRHGRDTPARTQAEMGARPGLRRHPDTRSCTTPPGGRPRRPAQPHVATCAVSGRENAPQRLQPAPSQPSAKSDKEETRASEDWEPFGNAMALSREAQNHPYGAVQEVITDARSPRNRRLGVI